MSGTNIICFDDLYSEDPYESARIFAPWADQCLKGFGCENYFINPDRIWEFITSLRKSDFPANGGFEKASPFKKAANVFVWLQAIAPFKEPLKSEQVGEDLARLSNNANVLVGYTLVQEALTGAKLFKKNGEQETVVTLEKPMRISRHMLVDLAEAAQRILPDTHFKTYSVLFEALCYNENGCGYPRVI
ncbi:hypothetical protein JIN84_05125 [Luteolibacter yonseiensis]|uniref:Uncharacterized protein n=1 Tax=Luteolibacter yonseiensis TaxID=1144680 RepID=A0A934VAB7_9BACT|nr:hypothetical protein [Luteolibacter yonseiensis]MBK1814985.1 hypothetical protein [Luteolibacter yonseiensis]